MTRFTINPDGTIEWTGPLRSDGDGENGTTNGIACYAPAGVPSLDYLANAGKPGDWWALVCDPSGVPIRQGKDGPAPGAYISTTSYYYPNVSRKSPLAYLAAGTVPFVVVTSKLIRSVGPIVMGCRAVVTDAKTKLSVEAVVGDVGPDLGEYSMAVAKALQQPSSPKNGGCDDPRFHCKIWPGVPALGFRLQKPG